MTPGPFARIARAHRERAEAARCATEAHPPSRVTYLRGDYATPWQRVCGRCGAVLETYPIGVNPTRPGRTSDAEPGTT